MESKKCESCTKWQQRLIEAGDGSHIICTHLGDDDSNSMTTQQYDEEQSRVGEKREGKFISTTHFDKKAVILKPKEITKWADLDINTIYKVNDVRERIVNIDGGKKIARYAELDDIDGERKNVWLPSIVDKELKDCDCLQCKWYLYTTTRTKKQ